MKKISDTPHEEIVEALIKLATDHKSEAEAFYLECGPSKQEQEDHYLTGVSDVDMNVRLLEDWLWHAEWDFDGNPQDCWNDLPGEDRRKVWEASGFHCGIMGYEKRDADFYWEDK